MTQLLVYRPFTSIALQWAYTGPGARVLRALIQNKFFEFAIYSSDTRYRKPHPSIFELAIQNLNMKPEEILFVGDNVSVDVVGAKNVGMKSAWINRERKDILAGFEPDYELHSLEDLLRIGSPNL